MNSYGKINNGNKLNNTKLDETEINNALMEILRFFTSTERKSAKREQCRENLKTLEIISHDIGLSPDQITQLIDVIGGKKFSNFVSKKLIRLLIPAEVISVESVIRAVSWICTRTLSLSIQMDLLKWIATFYDFIDNKNDFHALYGVLFLFLASDVLCPIICYLLYIMTEDDDVLPNRIRYLISLQSKVGAHYYVTELLNSYHSYRPNMVVLKYKCRKQEKINPFHSLTAAFEKLYKQARFIQNKKNANKSYSSFRKDLSTDIFGLKSYRILEKTLHLAELPGAVKLVLESPFRRLYLTSCREPLLIQLQFWIYTFAYDEIMSYDKLKIEEFLQLVIDLSDELQEVFPDVLLFLRNSVALHNDSFSASLQMSLLEYLPFCKIEETFHHMYEMFCCSSLEYKCGMIKCLTQLYLNWHLLEIPRYKWRLRRQREETDSSKLEEIITTFHTDANPESEPEEAIMQLIKYIGKLITLALYMHRDYHVVILHHSFLFYSMVLDICEQQKSQVISPPPKAAIYGALFSCNSFALTRMCHLMTRYRKVIIIMKKRAQAKYINDVIATINSYILDISNSLWRCKTFQSQKASIFQMQDIPTCVTDTNSSINDQFSLYHHPATVWLAREFILLVGEDRLDVAENLLSNLEMRNEFLQMLTEMQLNGIVDFIHTFIRQPSKSAT